MLIPSGGVEKSMRAVIGVFFLCCIVIPLSNGIPQIDFGFSGTVRQESEKISQNIRKKIQEQQNAEINRIVTEQVLSLLDANGYSCKKITVNYTSGADSSISINQVRIYIENPGQAEEIAALLTKGTGFETEVIAEGG